MNEKVSRGHDQSHQNPTRVDEEDRQPTAKWRLDYFESGNRYWYVVKDEEDKPMRTIKGQQARHLKQILTALNPHISQDMIDAFRPLVLEAFAEEVGLYEEDYAYQNKLNSSQPRLYPSESPEEVYRRYWTGHLMKGEVSAQDLAERIIKSEDRVRVAVAWGNYSEADINEKTRHLASIIREFHPNGPRGK